MLVFAQKSERELQKKDDTEQEELEEGRNLLCWPYATITTTTTHGDDFFGMKKAHRRRKTCAKKARKRRLTRLQSVPSVHKNNQDDPCFVVEELE